MPEHLQAQVLLEAYRAEVEHHPFYWQVQLKDLAAGRAILEADPAVQIALLLEVLRHPSRQWSISYTLPSQLCKRGLPYTQGDLSAILQILSALDSPYSGLPIQAILRALARPLTDPALLAACRADLERLQATARTWYACADQRKFLRLLEELLGGQQAPTLPLRVDAWGTPLVASLTEMEPALREQWLALLRHCAAASGSTPSAKWLLERERLLTALSPERFCRLASEWIGAFHSNKGARLDEENATLLKGLAWCCLGAEDAVLAATLADAAIEGYRKLSGIGPRSVKVASACIYALKQLPGLHGAAQLERVRLGVKQPTYLKGIEQALDEAALRAGMSRADLVELTVPTFALEQGRRRVLIGSAVAELAVTGLTAQIHWSDADGNPLKKEPAEVRRTRKAELKDLQRLSDDLTRMLGAQRDRLERLHFTERQWMFPAWRERYVEHPLVGLLTKRLIWRFTDGECIQDAIWYDGQLVDAQDHPLDLPETAVVSLWHPALADAAAVLAWRVWLERHQITQPFKQAHREVYLLTDAERATRVYSNRFAAHILRQHQFNALAATRGWRNQLRLMVDDSYPPATLDLPHWGLRAEFWIEGAGADYGVDTNDAGTYLYVATDQVRFYRIEAAENLAHAGGGGYSAASGWRGGQHAEHEPLPLEQIPPLVFSEVLRDVDLFVGVASVGNDPTWLDGGHEGRYHAYWHSYSFGELSATAETRKHLLSRLVPRLTIASRCAIEGRFLRVRGDLRTYKIHLGSGNILMEPNDQYLCIVPGRDSSTAATEHLFLPFEGDTVLSIILSKAFLLAEDTRITDPTITRQIVQG